MVIRRDVKSLDYSSFGYVRMMSFHRLPRRHLFKEQFGGSHVCICRANDSDHTRP